MTGSIKHPVPCLSKRDGARDGACLGGLAPLVPSCPVLNLPDFGL